MKLILSILLVLVLLITMGSCGSIVPQQPSFTETALLEVPERTGALKLPIEIDLTPYLDLVDKEIPSKFWGKDDPCDGVAYSYYFKREPIQFEGNKSTMTYNIDGEYNIRANYCAKCAEAFGSGPFCLTPRIYVSCGVGEPLRKIQIGFESKIALEANYLLKSKTSLVKTNIINPCKLSFINYDASKIIEKEISTALIEMEDEIDEQIASVDMKSTITEVWDALQESMLVEGMGYLNLRPQEIDVEPITFKKQKGYVTVNLVLSPVFSTDSINLTKKSLPFLTKIKSKKDFSLPILTLASYDSINSILSQNMDNLVIPYKKKKIIITSAKALGPVGSKLLFEVIFTGSKKGKLYLIGTPAYDSKTHIISFPDLEFDIRSRDAILKSAKWLFDKKLTTLLREKALYDLTEQLELARNEIETQLNIPMEISKGQFAYFSGKLTDFNISTLNIGTLGIQLIVDLSGNLSIRL